MSTQLLSVVEAGRRIGKSRHTVYRLIASGDLPAVNTSTGNRPVTKITEAAIEKWIHERTSNAGDLRRTA